MESKKGLTVEVSGDTEISKVVQWLYAGNVGVPTEIEAATGVRLHYLSNKLMKQLQAKGLAKLLAHISHPKGGRAYLWGAGEAVPVIVGPSAVDGKPVAREVALAPSVPLTTRAMKSRSALEQAWH